MKKRLLSLLLALTLTFALLPLAAYAANVVEIVSPKYDMISTFQDDFALVRLDSKWGYIDKTGREILPLIYDRASHFSDGLAVVAQAGKEFVIDKSGKVIFFAESFNGSFPFRSGSGSLVGFREGLAAVMKDGKFGYIDKTGKLVIPATFSWAGDFSEGLAQIKQDDKYGFIDKSGTVVIPPTFGEVSDFSQGVAQIAHKSRTLGPYGLIDKRGNVLVSPKYTEIGEFFEGLAAVRLGSKYGYIDKSGKEVIAPVYSYAGDFSEGLAVVQQTGDCGYIDKTGKIVLRTYTLSMTDFSGGLAAINRSSYWILIDKNGKEVIPLVYKFGPFDETGRMAYASNYDGVGSFSAGFASFTVWHYGDGLIDQYGNEVVPPDYGTIEEFSGGVARVQNGDKFGLLALSADPLAAIPTTSKVLVNGSQTAFDAYTINGNNYFKLRDIAMILRGTDKQFDVSWDGEKAAINLISNAAYTPIGAELQPGDGQAKQADWNTSKIYMNGKQIALTACKIGGNTYFKLRDLGRAFDFYVGWDANTSTVSIDTNENYESEYPSGVGG